MRCGIEFEYLMVDLAGPTPGRVRDFSNLAYPWISRVLADKPGCDDLLLATRDLGIKRGYWYLEGDERLPPMAVLPRWRSRAWKSARHLPPVWQTACMRCSTSKRI